MRTIALLAIGGAAGVLAGCSVQGPYHVGLDGDVPDGSDGPVDARVDAGADASPVCNLNVATGAAADLVLGQTGFNSNDANDPFESASSMKTVTYVHTDGTRLWTSDRGNYRVLQWNNLPIVNAEAANVVIGQASMISHVTGMQSQTILDGGGPIFSVDGKVLVSDITEHRVLIWNSIPNGNTAPANVVLGQTTFTGNTSGTGASNFNGPSGIWSDGTRLAIADVFNSRVLIWNTFPTANGEAADIVLGWPNFGTGGPVVDPPTASSLAGPRDVGFDGQRFYVADTGNSRVLIWNTFPTANNQPADVVVGQSSFTNKAADAGSPDPNPIGLNNPYSIAFGCGAMFIADYINARVVVHNTLPTSNGESADIVLGKPDFATGRNATIPPSDSWMTDSRGVAVAGQYLYATDQNRVLRFRISD